MYNETKIRTTIRLVLWRVVAFAITIITSLILTGDIQKALEIGLADIVAKLIIHYMYERGWNIIKWGKRTAPVIVENVTLPHEDC